MFPRHRAELGAGDGLAEPAARVGAQLRDVVAPSLLEPSPGQFSEDYLGLIERKVKAAPYQRPTTRHSSNPTPRGRSTTKGAFGGTGTGRGRRGMPGRKLMAKTVKAGWEAQKRVMPKAVKK